MEYKGQRVLCDEDDLIVVVGDGDFQVGYYGAGGVFVELDSAETEEKAFEILDFIYDQLDIETYLI